MAEILKNLSVWQCFFSAGLIFMLLELCFPAFFLLWVGMACLLTASTLFLHAFDPVLQVLFFSSYCVLSLVIGYFYYQRKTQHHVTRGLNNKEEHLIGKVFTLDHPLHVAHSEMNYKCYATLNDVRWIVQNIHDVEIKAQTKVRIVAVQENTLIIEAI
jgi:membrane protein implicated in regulation of membrane protease activity